MKFSTFYFSGTGNTKWVVEEFNKIVNYNGYHGELYSIEDQQVQDKDVLRDILINSDYIGFANPIYGANIPPIMRDFIDIINKLMSQGTEYTKPIYIINTFGYINGFGPICAKKLFSGTELKLRAYLNIRICNNISTPKIKSKQINKDVLKKRKEKAKNKLHKMMKKLVNGKKYITGIGPYLIPGILIRKKLEKKIQSNYKSLSVSEKTCNRCMLCVKNCPTNSIKYKDNEFEFLSSCTACMRCYNYCPTYSILIDKIYASPDDYNRHRGIEIEK